MRILQIVLLLSVCDCSQVRKLRISEVLEIAKLSRDVVTDESFKWLPTSIAWLSPKVKSQKELFNKFKVVNKKIEKLKAQMGIGSHILYVIVAYTDVHFQLKVIDAIKNIEFINFKFKDMGTFLESKAANDDLTLEEFARSVVSHSNSSLQSLLDRIHAIIAPEEDDVPNVFKILHEIMKDRGNKIFCNMQTSEQQLYLGLYNTLALTEIKVFSMIEFSHMLLTLHNQGNFTKEIEAAQERYKNRSVATLKWFIRAATLGDSYLWKCDPYKQVKNETYIEITEFLQGYIENQQDLDLRRTCFSSCDKYKSKRNSKSCSDYWGQHMFCNKNRQCKGNIINCQFMGDASVCLADSSTNRRYEYIEQGGYVLGRKKECEHDSTRLEGWFYSRRGYNCDYCMCFCDEQGVNSDRYFNLRSTESDIHDNMVITGLRFVKKNRIIHLQIQQGKLLPSAQIDAATVHWKPVENYTINSPRVRDGTDYHTLTWDKRGFDLHDLRLEANVLLTHVRFMVIRSNLNFHIGFTAFNFTTGKLYWWKSSEKSDVVSPPDRIKINLENKDIPIRTPDHSRSVSSTCAYLEFTHTSLARDVAQTTVPFIDAQAVTSAKPVPLSGAGVLFKGYGDSGGFIYPRITTYDYSRFFDDDDTHFGKKVVDKK